MSQKYLTAIIVCGVRAGASASGPIYNPDFLKYHNIKALEPAIKQFMKFAQSKKNAQYVNFYPAEGGKCVERRYFP